MNCREFKNEVSEIRGKLPISESARIHAENCPECRQYLDNIHRIAQTLDAFKVPTMSIPEAITFRHNLERNIDNYVNRAFGFYRVTVRYGIVFSAMVLVIFISLMPRFSAVEQQPATESVSLTANYEAEIGETESLDDQYVGSVIENLTGVSGFESGEVVLGELSEDEFDYLFKKINSGDLL